MLEIFVLKNDAKYYVTGVVLVVVLLGSFYSVRAQSISAGSR